METDIAAQLHDVMARNMWGVYLCLLAAPFVQEDAAVIGAASLSLGGMGDGALLFAVAAAGLTASDLWKYWLGRAARTRDWARKFAEKPAVARAQTLVLTRLGATLMTVRFVPGARIPLYIAAGYFRAHWPSFACWIALSAVLYVAAAFALFHTVGAVAGEGAKFWLPAVAIGALFVYLAVRRLRAANGAEASGAS